MQTHSPTIDRIGAALKALRQTHGHAQSEDKVSLGAKCLHVILAQLTEEGVPQEDLQPLNDLEASLLSSLRRRKAAASPTAAGGVRRASPCSPAAPP